MMAGKGIVLSHSRNLTSCAYAIGEAFKKAGAPEGAFEVILIATEDIVNVINNNRIAAVTLTGSVRAGTPLRPKPVRCSRSVYWNSVGPTLHRSGGCGHGCVRGSRD